MLLQMTGNIHCAGTFPDCINLVEDIKAIKPDIVLMDIDMPEINGIQATVTIKKYFHLCMF